MKKANAYMDQKNSSKKRLRILLIVQCDWLPEFGLSQVLIDLGRELENLGHSVEHFSADMAICAGSRNRFSKFFDAIRFSRSALQFVRTNGHKFDVIQTQMGVFPYSKSKSRFSGLLITRSDGLPHFYAEFEEEAARKWPEESKKGSLFGAVLRRFLQGRKAHLRKVEKSIEHSDSVILINRDEEIFVSKKWIDKICHFLPNGLTEERYLKLASAQPDIRKRADSLEVVFLGHWSNRKGAKDWPKIVEIVLTELPKTTFTFLGTGGSAQEILMQFSQKHRDQITVVPHFASDEAAPLLAKAKVGAFPSYIEGFGLAVLEKLAAGIPVIAYDVPGPREMLRQMPFNALVVRGDVRQFADRLIHILVAEERDYACYSESCVAIANSFKVSDNALLLEQIILVGSQKLQSN